MNPKDSLISVRSSSDDSSDSDDADIPAVLPSAAATTDALTSPTQTYLGSAFKVSGAGDRDEGGEDDGEQQKEGDEMELDNVDNKSAAAVDGQSHGGHMNDVPNVTLRTDHPPSSRLAPIYPERWDKNLVAEINRVFAITNAVYAMKNDIPSGRSGPRNIGHSIRELHKLPSSCFSGECRRLLVIGQLQRRAAPKSNFILKLGAGRTTNLMSLILYLTGVPAKEPCTTCLTPARASYFGPQCVVATDPDIFRYIKGACACCYYSKNGCECDHAKNLKAPSSHKKQTYKHRVRKRPYKYDPDPAVPVPPLLPSPSPVTQPAAEFAEPPAAAQTHDEKMAHYSEIYGGTDTAALLEEQRELIGRMELLNRFLGVRFQLVKGAMG